MCRETFGKRLVYKMEIHNNMRDFFRFFLLFRMFRAFILACYGDVYVRNR